MAQYVDFPCGCRFPVLRASHDPDIMPSIDFNIDEIREDCPATWELLGTGNTRGCFQLESHLGQTWARKLKPEFYEHLGALAALLRPGCLKAVNEQGVSMTQLYCRRKNNEEPVDSYHPAIDPILKKTYNVMVYQEQAMAIAVAVAGFSLLDADALRKACGKKLAEEMAKVKIMFLDGCKKTGILTDHEASEVFSWIEKSQRYSFNASHAISYGITGYQTAYLKAHFPLQFFTSWLAFAKEKQNPHEEVAALINDARLTDIDVLPPDIRSLKTDFHNDGKIVRFGMTNIKGVGLAQVEKLKAAVNIAKEHLKKPVEQWTWFEFLVFCSNSISSNVMASLIKVGAFRWMGLSRTKMKAEYEAWNGLTEKEQQWVQAQCGMVFPEEPKQEKQSVEDKEGIPPESKPKTKRGSKKKTTAEVIADAQAAIAENESEREPLDLDVLNEEQAYLRGDTFFNELSDIQHRRGEDISEEELDRVYGLRPESVKVTFDKGMMLYVR